MFINNNIIFSDTLENYVNHLIEIYKLFVPYNIALSLTKPYFVYPNVKFLNFRIDILRLFTTVEKTEVV